MALALGLVASLPGILLTPAPALASGGQSFTFLQAPFTQSLYGVGSPSNLFGGVAFASNGDPLTDDCSTRGTTLYRFDSTTTLPTVNGTSTLHPLSTEASSPGCGLTNNPNGAIYSNTSAGVVKLDATTGALLAGPFGAPGNALGIATDPQTGNLVYNLSSGNVGFVDAGFTTSGVFTTVTAGDFDQITFDPTGNFLFLSNVFANALTIIMRNGTLVQNVGLTFGSSPDGIAFHSAAPQFVLTNNNDGSMTRFDFPNSDYTMTPTQSVFASGGFRGDMTQVGADGCLYATQNATRYDDGTIAGTNSLVRVCPGFAPPPGVGGGSDVPATTKCTVSKTGNIGGAVLAQSGTTCLDKAVVTGAVIVSPGAQLSITNSTVQSVSSTKASAVTICNSAIGSTLSIRNSTGFVLIGDGGDGPTPACLGNTVGGSVVLSGNTGGVELGGTRVTGSVVVSANVAPNSGSPTEDHATEIEGNTIKGSLSCTSNTPVVTTDKVANVVAGGQSGSCGP